MPRLTRRWPKSGNRSLKTAVLMCALAIPALTGCEAGLNAPTLQFHPAADGATAAADGVAINNAFVLGPAIGQTLPAGSQAGLFLSISSANGDRLKSVSAPGTAASVNLIGGPVDVAANSVVNLTGPAPRIVLTGLSTPLKGGETVQLVLTFARAGSAQLQVPVQPQAYGYATYAQPPTPTPSPTPSPSATKKPSATPSATP